MSRATAVLMPTTSPAALTSGPPELPDEIAASVWISPSRKTSPWADRAIERRDDAERHRRFTVEAECESDRHHVVAEADAAGVGERGGLEAVAAHPEQRKVVATIGGEQVDLARLGLAGQPHADLGRPVDDVGVGEDLSVGRR